MVDDPKTTARRDEEIALHQQRLRSHKLRFYNTEKESSTHLGQRLSKGMRMTNLRKTAEKRGSKNRILIGYHKKPRCARSQVVSLLVMCFFLCSLTLIVFIPSPSSFDLKHGMKLKDRTVYAVHPLGRTEWRVSAVVLTYHNYQNFHRLLKSILKQRDGFFELIIADAGCLAETADIVEQTFNQRKNWWLSHKYFRLCDNPGYAVNNNEAVKLADASSQWILLLNDDIVMQGDDFVSSLLQLGESKVDVAAVGCSLRTIDGMKVLESGSIVWNDGSAAGYGRDRIDLDASDLTYPRPVDYVSGACLMVRKTIFDGYGGFDGGHFPNYYEDTDLQMHIQHDLGQQVWFQPKAVALHDEHGSFGLTESVAKMERASVIFRKKWEAVLTKHLPSPANSPSDEKKVQLLVASDIRARDASKARILYLDDHLPNPHKGSGYGRAFDNLSMMAELGHRITVASLDIPPDEWCDETCRDDIRNLGVELVMTSWEATMEDRPGFYDIVIISRPPTFRATYAKWREFFRKSPFGLIYDCEALWYRRDEEMLSLYRNGTEFPTFDFNFDLKAKELEIRSAKESEIKLMTMADVVLAVSEKEKEIISGIVPDVSTHVVGHVMNVEKGTSKTKGYNQRHGILFIASFHGSMYYNGDAIWYFLKKIYPLVIKEVHDIIPLTVAGRKIPDYILKYVGDAGLSDYVTFLESPDQVAPLYESHRIFIAPHMYGSGIQYKISEALSFGIPCVTSKLSANAFGLTHDDEVVCIGETPELFMKCVVAIHGSVTKWTRFSESGRAFIRKTHNRAALKQKLEGAISVAQSIQREMKVVHNSNMQALMKHRLFSSL